MTLGRIQHLLIYCFAFFGPLGTLLTPGFMPNAFRFHHFFFIFFPLFFIKIKYTDWKTVLTFTPFLLYCLISAYFTHNSSYEIDSYPLPRALLLISQCLFMFGAAFCLKEDKKRIFSFYLAGFFISLLVGFFFFIGYYTGLISFETTHRFSVESQMAWGLLRFSPGSYPNEYGTISSFVLSLLLMMYAKNSRFFTFLFALLTFIALLLTTTRAAYLSFGAALVYLSIVSPEIRKYLFKFLSIGTAILFLLKAYFVNFFSIFVRGMKAITLLEGSAGIRLIEWIKGFKDLDKNILFGNGFSANIYAHNVYLELLFELGLVGIVVLIGTLVYYLSENSYQIRKIFLAKEKGLYDHATIVGLIHLFLFALTNHNMHHHLTWMIFLVFNHTLYSEKKKDHLLSKASYLSRISA